MLAAQELDGGDAFLGCPAQPIGEVVPDGSVIMKRLVAQVSTSVRWDLCMERFKELGVTALLEVAPAGTLVGLAKRALPGVKTLALKTPDDIEAATALIAEHAA